MARKAEVKVRITGDSKSAEQAAKKTEGAFTRMGSAIKRNALAITAAIGSLLVVFRQLDKEARLQGQTEALKRNLAAQGVALDDFMAKMKAASDAQLSSAQVIEAAGKAMVLGIPADKMAELMEVAKASAIALGTEVGTAFEDLTLGLARRSLPILDNLGFTTTDLTKAKEDFAQAIGKTVDALSGEETAAALLNGVLVLGKERIAEYGDAQSETARAINQAKAAMEDVSRGALQTLNAAVLAAATGVVGFAKAVNLLGRELTNWKLRQFEILKQLPGIGRFYEQIAANTRLLAAEHHEAAVELDELGEKLKAATTTMLDLALGETKATKSADNLKVKLGQAGDAADTAAGHFKTAEEAALGLGSALGEVTSIELAIEIEKINEALVESKAKLGENSDEYIRLEQIASDRIERLRARINSLRDGLGDLTTATKESSNEWTQYAAGADRAAIATDRLTTSAARNVTVMQQQREAVAGDSYFAQIGGGTFTQYTQVVQDPDGRVRVV